MKTKHIEIRDHMTMIPALAIMMDGDHWLQRRAGYGAGAGLVLLIKLAEPRSEYDPYSWGSRTMAVAHQELQGKWDTYSDGDLLDVRFVRGETDQPCASEEPVFTPPPRVTEGDYGLHDDIPF